MQLVKLVTLNCKEEFSKSASWYFFISLLYNFFLDVLVSIKRSWAEIAFEGC